MRKLIGILFCFFAVISGYSQYDHQTVTNFTPRDYGQAYSNYTQAITEDARGLIYVGTASGVLQYDGYIWRFIPVKAGAYVTSLACEKNIVYVGSQGDFGYLTPDAVGKLAYVSLADSLKDEDKAFSSVWKTLVCGEKIVFQADERMFFYENAKIKVIKPQTTFHLAFSDGKSVFVRQRGVGLTEFSGNTLGLVKGGEQFADTGIFAILPYDKTSRLLVTQESGLFVWADGQIVPMKQDVADKNRLLNAMIIGAKKLSDGNFALYGLKDGVIVIDSNGKILSVFGKNAGFRSSEIQDLWQDRYGNIWAATQKGVSRIQYSSPVSFFNESAGISGNVRAVTSFKSQIFIGTSEGLYSNSLLGSKIFAEAEQIKGSIWVLQSTEKGVFIGGENGLWFTDGNKYLQVSKAQCSGLLYVSEQKWLIAAGNTGVTFFNSETLSMLLNLPEVMIDSYGIARVKKDDGTYEIWLGSKTQGVSQIIISADMKYQVDFFVGMEDGLPNDWVCAYQSGNKVVFGTSLGMLRFISPDEIAKLAGDSSSVAVRGYFDIVDFPKESSGRSVTSFIHTETDLFAALDNYVYRVQLKDSIAKNDHFKTVQLGRFNVIYSQQNFVWIGGDDGLALFDSKKAEKQINSLPEIGIRKITIGKDSLIWFGDVAYSDNEVSIPFTMNSLRVEFFSLFSDNGFKLQYAWKLEGGSNEYSDWSNDQVIYFSHLTEGSYVLQVKARTPNDSISNEISLRIHVFPPWYRSWWAYVIYGILVVLSIYLLILLNTRRLKEKNRKLEEIVQIRTQEVVQQKHEIELQKETIEEILNDLNASISYAQRIQEAILPSEELLRHCFPDHFILYRPRNVVSGDYYWASQIGDWTIITVADCTGHGVPGAFMSMLGISFLNEIVRKKEVTAPDKILNALRDAVIEALRQSLTQGKQKDGMDISLCAINKSTMQCLWAGANNPLYIIKAAATAAVSSEMPLPTATAATDLLHSQLLELKGDKMPIGIHVNLHPFHCHEFKLEPGDCLYMTSDGYPDQFGGPKGKKFMSKNLKELLISMSQLPMEDQKVALEKALDEWMKAHNENFEQVDDITLMGIRI